MWEKLKHAEKDDWIEEEADPAVPDTEKTFLQPAGMYHSSQWCCTAR